MTNNSEEAPQHHSQEAPPTQVEEITKGTLTFPGKYKDAIHVSSIGENLSPILTPGQTGYTDGVFNCIALAVPERIMHSLPNSAVENAEKFFDGLAQERIKVSAILLAGGAKSGKQDYLRVKALIKHRLGNKIKITEARPKDDNSESIMIGVDRSKNKVAYFTHRYAEPLTL